MTDRYNAPVVVLERDIRSDDAEGLIAAIKQLRSVASVKPNVADITSHTAEQRARLVLEEKLWKVLED